MAKQLRLDVAQLTDVGRKREHNEDNMAYVIPKDPLVMAKKGALFIVADGMGGHAAGEVASEIAVDTVSNVYYQDDSDDVATSLLHAIRRANGSIHQRAAENMLRSGMGTTCVGAVLRGNMAYIANVGDSRAYLVRAGQVKQISQDHSWVYEQVRAGLLTEDQARTHAQRNVITRSLGTQAEVEIDVFHEQLQEDDTLILCTDGLSGLVSDEELQRIVDQFVPQESVYHLVERANENGGPDNITAIVVHVQEVGVEPPGVRHPVPVGGREMGDVTTIAQSPTMPPGSLVTFPAHNGELTPSGVPLRLSSGPLASPESVTAPQPALEKPRGKRSRLFYPSLALLAIFILALVAGAVYYFTRSNNSQTVNTALAQAQHLMSQAQRESSSNPTQALADLSSAQKDLRSLQKNYALDSGQNQQATQLQNSLVGLVKVAITQYDGNAKISLLLPCSGISINSINNTSTHTQAQSVVPVTDSKGAVWLYALGQDPNQDTSLYRLNEQSSLIIGLINVSHVLNISSNGSSLFVLAEQIGKNSQPSSYSLSVYQPDQTGKLNRLDSVQIDPNLLKPRSYAPLLVTAWNSNVYVVLSSQANQNKDISVLSYGLAKNHLGTPKAIDFSVSNPIVSAAAFANEFFFLRSDGSLQSFPLPNAGNQSGLPANVLVQSPVALPLAVAAGEFNAHMEVPTPSQAGQQGSGSIAFTLPGISPTNAAATLATGLVGTVPHLYIGDSANHRVLDLIQSNFSASGPAGSTPTPSSTAGSGGQSVPLQLVRQYVSSGLFAQVKSVAVKPKSTQLYVLSQSSAEMLSLVSYDGASQNGCAS